MPLGLRVLKWGTQCKLQLLFLPPSPGQPWQSVPRGAHTSLPDGRQLLASLRTALFGFAGGRSSVGISVQHSSCASTAHADIAAWPLCHGWTSRLSTVRCATRRDRRAVLPEQEGSGAGPLPPLSSKKEDFCRLNKDVGPCMGMNVRFFYNSSSMACETFHYGGCLGNGNNFPSEKECLQTCRTEAACRLPIVPGPCQQPVKLWAFDATQGKCTTFNYGGCQGNGNKFYTEKECKEYCGVPADGEEEFLGLSN